MAYSDRLETNNTNLQNCINKANALPDAGSGGGGDIEVCSLSTGNGHSSANPYYLLYNDYEGGQISCKRIYLSDILPNSLISDNVVKNSFVIVDTIYCETNLEPSETEDLYDANDFVFRITGDSFFSYTPCFAYNTKILLSDRTSKPVQDITYQDNLLVWDFDNGCYSSAKPVWIKKAQTTNYYYLCKFDNGVELKLIGSDGKCHRVFDIEKGSFESATDCVGKRVMSEQGETILLSCERVDEEVEFYNIITHTHINLFAENILTSCRLNNIYPIENMKFIKDNRVKKIREDYPNIGSDMFRGLRIAEQSMSKEEIDAYIERLYSLIDYKTRYFVDDHTGTGNVIELTQDEYFAIIGSKNVRPYVGKAYRGEISIDEVPEELREQVQVVVNNRIARFGEYKNQEITSNEFQNLIEEVL